MSIPLLRASEIAVPGPVRQRWVATNRNSAPVMNPATEETITAAPWGARADADAAVSAARQAFDDGPWPKMTPAQRSTALGRLRDVLAGWADDIVGLVVAEAGIPVSVARPSQFDAPMQLFDFFIDRCAAFEASATAAGHDLPEPPRRQRVRSGCRAALAARRRHRHHAVQRSLLRQSPQGRPRSGGRLHGRVEALGFHTVGGAAVGCRGAGSGLAPGCAQRGYGRSRRG